LRVATERVATPEPLMAALPREVVPSRKVTLPVGAAPAEVTEAVRVMVDCANAGFALEVRVIVGLCLSWNSQRSLRGQSLPMAVESIAAEEPEVAVFAGPADGGFARAGDVGGGGDAECAVDAVLAIADADSLGVFHVALDSVTSAHPGPLFGLEGETPEIVEWVDDSVGVVEATEEPEIAVAVDGADWPTSAARDVCCSGLADGAVDAGLRTLDAGLVAVGGANCAASANPGP
jgi:hypothetical protein